MIKHANRTVGLTPIEWAVTVLQLVITIVLSIYLVTYVQQQRERADLVECQSRLNTAFRQALAARSDSAARERQAQRALLSEPITDNAIATYLDALDAADREREAFPLPTANC